MEGAVVKFEVAREEGDGTAEEVVFKASISAASTKEVRADATMMD